MTEDARLADRPRARKSAQAFRTISEAADEVNVPQHVLRFWETKFGQLQPMKRGGGRRYYRPEDLALLRRISGLLYTEGYTIKGVQRLLEESEPQPALLLPAPEEQSPTAGLLEEMEAIAQALRRMARR